MWKNFINFQKYLVAQNQKRGIEYINKNQINLNNNHKYFLVKAPGPTGFTSGF